MDISNNILGVLAERTCPILHHVSIITDFMNLDLTSVQHVMLSLALNTKRYVATCVCICCDSVCAEEHYILRIKIVCG